MVIERRIWEVGVQSDKAEIVGALARSFIHAALNIGCAAGFKAK